MTEQCVDTRAREQIDMLMDAVNDLQTEHQPVDDEVTALEVAYKALKQLDHKAYPRACEWLRQRLEDDAIKAIEKADEPR